MLALFLVETKDRKHDSDLMYIKALIGHRYLSGKTKIDYIYMNGKGNYNRIEGKVHEKIKRYRSAPQSDKKVEVFLCVDTDVISGSGTSQENIARNQEIINYCKAKGWNIVWFCEDIEEAFLGHKISDKDKVKTATAFYSKGSIVDSDISKLSINNYDQLKSGTSNITAVLDQFFRRKQ